MRSYGKVQHCVFFFSGKRTCMTVSSWTSHFSWVVVFPWTNDYQINMHEKQQIGLLLPCSRGLPPAPETPCPFLPSILSTPSSPRSNCLRTLVHAGAWRERGRVASRERKRGSSVQLKFSGEAHGATGGRGQVVRGLEAGVATSLFGQLGWLVGVRNVDRPGS